MGQYLSFADARRKAKRRLPKGLFDYINRGVGDEASLQRIHDRLDATQVAPRVLRSNGNRNVETRLFGRTLSSPFVIAPTAMAGLIQANGEVSLARAAAHAGIPICLSTQSITSVEELRQHAPSADIWMQLYLWQDRDLSLSLLKRAAEAGSEVLVMTVDTPYSARKEWNIKSGFDMPFAPKPSSVAELALHPGWLAKAILLSLMQKGLPRLGNYPEGLQPKLLGKAADPRVRLRQELSWSDVDWVRSNWDGTLVIKGILTPEDAELAQAHGADGIVVSSHGARNFDAAPAPIDVLPGITKRTPDLCILADSGVRRGLDIFRYTHCGAQAVMLGRIILWALAAGGEEGVKTALDVLKTEFTEALDFAGHSNSNETATA